MKALAAREMTCKLLTRVKPFAAVIFLQIGLAGMDVLSKVALKEGMSNYVCTIYRTPHAYLSLLISYIVIHYSGKEIDQIAEYAYQQENKAKDDSFDICKDHRSQSTRVSLKLLILLFPLSIEG